MGSAGRRQVLVVANGRLKVFDKHGNLGGVNVDDLVFWNAVRAGQDVSDPHVEYDRLTRRWFVVAINLAEPENRIMIAVSSGPTITSTSSFTFFQFQQDQVSPAGDNNRFADYPTLGVDANALYIGVNNFAPNGSFASTTGFVVDKSSVLGAGPIVATAFRSLGTAVTAGPFSPQGVQNMDPQATAGYFIGVDTLAFAKLQLRRVSDPGGTPSISGNLAVPVPETSFPIGVPALGTSTTLDALDDRLFEAMIAQAPDGSSRLWTAHNIQVNSSGHASPSGGRDGSRWYEIGGLGGTPSLRQSGTVFDPAVSAPRFFWIPSIAANGQGTATLASSTAGVGRRAAVAATRRVAGDPAGTMGPFAIVQDSSSPYDIISTNPQRWGDYSQTVVDPTDNMTFWTFQEYANATNSWGVRAIQLKALPPAKPVSASPTRIARGLPSVRVRLAGRSRSGSAFFDPGRDPGGPGFPRRISAKVGGGVRVDRIRYVDPTHVVLRLDTRGARLGKRGVTVRNPDGQRLRGRALLRVVRP